MFSAFITTLLLAGQLSPSVCQVVGGDPSPPAVPQSLDNFGADVSDFSIMYTKNLEDVMRRFKITRAEMQEMLQQYVRGGQPAITKTVYNPETKLNETITLDFKSFTEDGPDFRPPGTPSGPVETVRVVNNQRPSVIGGAAAFRQNPTEVVPGTSDPGVAAPEWRLPPSPVMDGSNPSSATDLTAMREYEGNLIDDLKLLQRRRDALDESFAQGEINEEDYRTNVQNNEQQMRDAYMVLQQIQDGIREFLGIPVQRPSAINSIESTVGAARTDGTMTGNILSEARASPIPGMTPLTGGTLTPEDERILQSISQNQQGLPPPGLQGIQSTSQQLAGAGRPMTPEEEIKFLQSEIDLIRNANAEMLSSLKDLRMPSDGVPTAELPSTFDNDLQRLQLNLRDGTLPPDVSRDLPTPSPVPAVSDLTPLSDPYVAWNGPNAVDSVAGDVRRDFPSPSPVPGVSGFTSALGPNLALNIPSPVDPVVRDNQIDGFNDRALSDITPGLSSGSNVQNRINNLIDQYNRLNEREKDIIRILNNADPVQGPESISRDPLIDDVISRQNNIIDSGMTKPRRMQERLATVDPNEVDPSFTFEGPLPIDSVNSMEEINRAIRRDENLPLINPRTQPNAINNLLDEYSKLSQREDEIVRLLNMQGGSTNIGRTETMDTNVRLARREFDRSVSLPNPPVNIDIESTMDERGPTVISPDFRMSDNINRGDLENDILRRRQNIEAEGIFRNNLGRLRGEFDRSVPMDVNQETILNDPDIAPNYPTSDNTDPTILNREDPILRRLAEIHNPDLALNRDDRSRIPQQRSNIDIITPGNDLIEIDRMLNTQNVPNVPTMGMGINASPRKAFDRSITVANNIVRDNVGPLSGGSVTDRTRFPQQRPNIDNYLLSNPELRPTVGTPTVAPTTGDDSRSARTDTSDRNLIYNDGTITMEAVRYDLPSDAVDEPVGSDTALTSDFPISGFSNRASGLLTPRTDAFSLPNRRRQFFGQRRQNTIRNHIRLPFYRRQGTQGLERLDPARRVVSLF